MAQSSFPWENVNTSETQYSQLFRQLNNGVNGTPDTDDLEVGPAFTGLAVEVQAGEAMVQGHYYISTTAEELALATADPTNPRIDTVVLRLDPVANSIVLAVKTGTPAGSPVAPTLTQTLPYGVFEFPLADVLVPATAGTPDTITDRREFMGTRLGSWTTAGRPTPDGRPLFGFNLTTQKAEIYNTVASAWQDITPASLNDIGDVTITSATTGQILEWNGTAWVNGQVDTAGIANSAVTADKLASNAVTTAKIADANVTSAKLGAGTILQVVQTVKTDVFSQSVSSGGFSAEVTGLTATITPRSTSSKILVMVSTAIGLSAGKSMSVRLLKNGSPSDFIGDQLGTNRRRATNGNSTDNNPTSVDIKYLDSPNTTSPVTYGIDLHSGDSGTQTVYVNRSSGGDGVGVTTSASSITLMEVAA